VSARRLIFHPGLEDDLADAVAYYGEFDPSLAGRFGFRFLEHVERVELYPESGAMLSTRSGECCFRGSLPGGVPRWR
jgi:hypothetical protein